MKKYILISPMLALLFLACGDVKTTVFTKSFDESSEVVSDRVFNLAKECWENPNKKIADVVVTGLTTGETYKTKITQESVKEGTKIGAHYDIYDSNGKLKINQQTKPSYASLVTIIINDESNGSKATIESLFEDAVSEVKYWLDYNACRDN